MEIQSDATSGDRQWVCSAVHQFANILPLMLSREEKKFPIGIEQKDCGMIDNQLRFDEFSNDFSLRTISQWSMHKSMNF